MPKPTKGPRLGGSPAHQRLILANLAKSLIEHKAITTTEAKARRLRPYVEKLITKARRGDMHARRQALKVLGSNTPKREREFDAVYTLFDVIAPQIDPERKGGYTRIVKLAPRKGDNAPMAQISLVLEKVEKKAVVKKATADTKKAAATKKAEAEKPEANDEVTAAVEQDAPEAEVTEAVEAARTEASEDAEK